MVDDTRVLRAAVLAAFGYSALLAAAMLVAGHVLGVRSYEPDVVYVMLPAEAAMALFALVVARRIFGHWQCGFGPLRWRGLAWMLPYVALLAIFAARLLHSGAASASITALVTVLAMIALGVSEELMFRGILLQAGRRRLGSPRAVLLSAALFTLLHLVNLLAGLPLLGVLQQMSFACLFGIAMSCIALRANGIVPLMVFHSLWDMGQYLGRLWQVDFMPLYPVAILLNAVMAVLLGLSLMLGETAG